MKKNPCKEGLRKDILNKEVFDREIALCQMFSKDNNGKCCWGECSNCGVIPLLYKLHKGKLVEKPQELTQLRKEILG